MHAHQFPRILTTDYCISWPMILSGVQSTLTGAMFIVPSNSPETPHVTAIAPYAARSARSTSWSQPYG